MDRALDGVAVSKALMLRWIPFVLLAACASPKPAVVAPAPATSHAPITAAEAIAAFEARPHGKDVLADADRRWEAFQTAQAPAIPPALEEAKAAAPMVAGVSDRTPIVDTAPDLQRYANWLPDRHRFQIKYAYTTSQMQQGFTIANGGCNKYKNFPPRAVEPDPAPQSQPSPSPPMPCPPQPAMPIWRSWSATMGLVLEYSEDGKLVLEEPSPAAPFIVKRVAPSAGATP